MQLTADELVKTFGKNSEWYQKFFSCVFAYFESVYHPNASDLALNQKRNKIQNSKAVSLEERIQFHYGAVIINEFLKYNAINLPASSSLLVNFQSIPQDILELYLTDLKIFLSKFFSPSNSFNSEIPVDFFSLFVQSLMNADFQNEMGIVYTPFKLCSLLFDQLNSSYSQEQMQFPRQVVDPTCGTGRFLLSYLYLQLKHHKTTLPEYYQEIIFHLYAIDINPLALLAAYANCALFLQSLGVSNYIIASFEQNFLCEDLFNLTENFSFQHFSLHSFDWVIGNLPWNVLNNVEDANLRKKIESRGKQYDLFMTWKNRSNLELATVLVRIIIEFLLKPDGILGFLLPASILTGSQHAKFRRFSFLTDIHAVRFEPDLFPIHSMILFAKFDGNSPIVYKEKTIQLKWFENNHTSDSWNLIKEETQYPSYVNFYRKSTLVGKYFSRSGDYRILPIQKSLYYSKVHRGPDITPRKLLFIQSNPPALSSNANLLKIKPQTENIASTQSDQWRETAYSESIVNAQFIFDVVKSTDLLPYQLVSKHQAFLPIEIQNDHYGLVSSERLPLESASHYTHLEEVYRQRQKKTAKNQTLRQSLLYGKKLVNPNLTSPLKVVYPVGGSYSKAAILREQAAIVDVTFYYLVPSSESEAYYLLGWLNSPLLHQNLPRVCTEGAGGSIRVIHLMPWLFPLPQFNPENSLHIRIAANVKNLEKEIHQLYQEKLSLPHDLPKYRTEKIPLRRAYKLLRENSAVNHSRKELDKLYWKLFDLT